MSLVELTASYVDHLLAGLGHGMKSLLMDADTMSAISVSCPQSHLMSKGVYLFERLDERRKSKPLSFVTCVCIATPTPRHVDHLKQELQNPRFGRYHLFFTQVRAAEPWSLS
jgi:vacuolar protein sorting-associated protein 45